MYTAARLKQLLREMADPAFCASQQRFSREPLRTLGVRTPELRRLAAAAAKQYRRGHVPLAEILNIAERLRRGTALEDRALAIKILSSFKSQLGLDEWRRFDRWIDTLSNWAETDGLCVMLLAPILKREPGLVAELFSWTRGPNRWRRRAAAVALVPLARRGEQLDAAFEICNSLAEDRDDLLEKAIGWLLKEASRTQPRPVTGYLLKNIDRLSRTTVRYACEKLPNKLRLQVMSA